MLNEKQEKCINLMITTNKKQKQIANEINISEKTICEWKKQKEFKEEIQNSMRENLKMQAIKGILDRSGFKPTDKIEHSGNIESPHLTLLESINRQLGNNH